MRIYGMITWAVVPIFSIFILGSLPKSLEGQQALVLPSQFDINQRLAYGSKQLPNGRGTCGAEIYQLTVAQTEEIKRNGVATFSSGLKGPDGLKYEAWANTPVPEEIFKRYVLNRGYPPVGLNCSHGTWEKEWRVNAQKTGNFYSTNGKALILLQAAELKSNPNFLAAVGYFYNP